ncbi:hypothetical protein [Desulfatibacillum aliphaticivorans]|uniref:hypothetical protein n=1 Tax=Desulfatibacillum aliphaticivorans TaxID=218208 RepID=UPI000421F8D4|nr:hypothetical protein [Desulfatibacillum aliphaticivorans]
MEKLYSFAGEPIPWYDSSPVCGFCLALMALVFLFGAWGVKVGWEMQEFHRDVWVPGVLMVLAASVMLSLVVRLVQRRASRKGSVL